MKKETDLLSGKIPLTEIERVRTASQPSPDISAVTVKVLRRPQIKVKLDPRAMPFKPQKPEGKPSEVDCEELPELADLLLNYKLGAL